MVLIKSISGIRGTIGGRCGEGLGPLEIVKFSLAFGSFLQGKNTKPKVIIGRDSRPSGKTISDLAANSLSGLGIEVIDAGISSTPTVEIAVLETGADGGIIISASHNPNGWNCLKFINNNGEFLSQIEIDKILSLTESLNFNLADEEGLEKIIEDKSFLSVHLNKILALDLVDNQAIARRDFRIAIDGINSVGGRDVPELLQRLGVGKIEKLNCELSGRFAHNPEPLDKNLIALSDLVVEKKCDLGIVVDPDVDRLSLICEDGSFFNEEYVLVAVADYIFGKKGCGKTVSNLSSTRALKDIAEKHGGQYFPSAVGEAHVVAKMREVGALIGGEGNGGIIYPELHYGRDALAGIALFLSQLANFKGKCSELKKTFPTYFLSKNKIILSEKIDCQPIFSCLAEKYKNCQLNKTDGLRIDFDQEWVHLRPSNTESIIRVYAESISLDKADQLAQKIIKEIKEII